MKPADPFLYACPVCGLPLQAETPEALLCPADGVQYRRIDGIWRFLQPHAQARFARFMAEYELVRQAEGRGSADPAFYCALPFRDLTGRFTADWQIRAASYRALVRWVVAPLEQRMRARERGALKAADLGAGNGWLSYRLAQRGHQAAAVDLLTNPFDGLGAWVHYDERFIPIQAEFEALPFQSEQLDLVVFNASLHYSTGYEATLCEAWRTLKPGGVLVILDSPIYHQAASGQQMVREREAHFRETVGFASDALPSENFLTYERLDALAQGLGVRWRMDTPAYGLGWALRPWKARLRGQREPARFALVSATKPEESHDSPEKTL
jgi:SAM-dependent methyltransferase